MSITTGMVLSSLPWQTSLFLEPQSPYLLDGGDGIWDNDIMGYAVGHLPGFLRASSVTNASSLSHCGLLLVLLCSGRTRKVKSYHKGVGQAPAGVPGAQGLNLHGNRHALFTWSNE